MKPRRGQNFQCQKCGSDFYRPQSFIKSRPNVRYCSGECYIAACRDGEHTRKGPRPTRRLGETFKCQVCGTDFYRKRSQITRGVFKTCGKAACVSESMKGENNPFWGKDHTPEMREALSKIKSARESETKRRRYGPLPGGFTHTAEAKAKMSAALRKRWAENRDLMLSYNTSKPKPREEQRYRKCFTPFQRRTWMADKCAWCDATENLELDHIVPVRDDGFNIKENAQTLCKPCNLWKSIYVDRPSHLARLALQGGSVG